MFVFLYDEHKVRWYHGFSRPFGWESLFYFRKAPLKVNPIIMMIEKENVL